MNMNYNDFHQMVGDSRLAMRHGLINKINLINKHNVPMYVLSGGIKEIIEASLVHALQHLQQKIQCDPPEACLFSQFGL